ncbi:MAG: VanZ family protein [Dehalococcoidia bacterium]
MIRLALGFAALIAFLSVLADTRNLGPLMMAYDFPYGDKIGHIGLYGVLTLLVNLAVSQIRGRSSTRSVLTVSTIMLALVSLEELSQLLFPARTVDWRDLAASYIGVSYFACLSLFIIEWRRLNVVFVPRRA